MFLNEHQQFEIKTQGSSAVSVGHGSPVNSVLSLEHREHGFRPPRSTDLKHIFHSQV